MFLIYIFNERTFYINIDIFKRYEFEIIMFYFKIICLNSKKLKRINIELILFLNRIINNIEIKY